MILNIMKYYLVLRNDDVQLAYSLQKETPIWILETILMRFRFHIPTFNGQVDLQGYFLNNVVRRTTKNLLGGCLAEWLRRWTRNPLGSARIGSNPVAIEKFLAGERKHAFRRYIL